MNTIKYKYFNLVLVAVLLSFSNSFAAVGDITISIPDHKPGTGTMFTSEIKVDVGENVLGSYDFELRFDKDILRITDVQGGLTPEFSGSPLYDRISEANMVGMINVHTFNTNFNSPKHLVSLFRISFEVTGNLCTLTRLSIIVKKLRDGSPDANTIAYNAIDSVVGLESQEEGGMTPACKKSFNDVIGGDITVSVPETGLETGSIFTTEIKADVKEHVLGSYDFKLGFNPDVLQVIAVIGGLTLEFSGSPVNDNISKANETGAISVSSFNTNFNSPKNQISITRVVFRVIGALCSSSVLSITQAEFRDGSPDANLIACNTIDSTINIACPAILLANTAARSLNNNSFIGDITISAPEATLETSMNFTSEIKVDAGENVLGSYNLEVNFNKDVLWITKVEGGTTEEFSSDPEYNYISDANANGKINIVGSHGYRDKPNHVISIARISFDVVGEMCDSSELSINVNDLFDSDSNNINYSVINSTVELSCPVISVTPEFKDVSSINGTAVFNVINTGSGIMNWTANSQGDWLTIISGESGINSGEIIIDYKSNPGDARSVTIAVNSESATNSPQIVELRQAANVRPNISQIPDQSTVIGTPTHPINFTISDTETNPYSLTVLCFSSNSSLVINDNIVLSSSGPNCSLTITPADSESGQTTITVVVSDAGGLTASTDFILRITKTDSDGDGVPDEYDAFPNDKNEWFDTDKDGIGNNADLDDDDDEMPDEWEEKYGLNPIIDDSLEDPDEDGVTNIDEYKQGMDPTQPNSAPGTPILSKPADTARDISLTTKFESEAFSDPDINDTHSKTTWQVSMVSDFSLFVFDITNNDLTSLTMPDLILEGDTTYYWRVKFYDNHDLESVWSEPYSFTTQTNTDDMNSNGIPDSQEVDEDTDLDFNDISDINQDDIKIVNTGDSQIGVKNPSNYTNLVSVKSVDISEPNNEADEMLQGTISLKVIADEDQIEIIIYLSEAAPDNAHWYVYDMENGWQDYSDYTEFADDRKSIILEFNDGGIGDVDGTKNGIIVVSGGIGILKSSGDSGGGGGGGGCFIQTTAVESYLMYYLNIILNFKVIMVLLLIFMIIKKNRKKI
ncbi:exported hypothetical protein [Candidatus Magnetomoraceae bacterium gMMP-13]